MAQHTKKSFLMILLQPYFTKKSANEVDVYPGTTLRSTGKNAKSNEIARRDIFVVRPWFLSSLSLSPPPPPSLQSLVPCYPYLSPDYLSAR